MTTARPAFGNATYGPPRSSTALTPAAGGRGDSLADLLERVLDKGVVIAGDIVVNVLDIELLTLKVRLLIASADTAKEMGIDWWTDDPFLSGRAKQLETENRELRERLERLERAVQRPAEHDALAPGSDAAESAGRSGRRPAGARPG